MPHNIQRVALRMAQVSVLTALFCLCGVTFAQGTKVSASSGSDSFDSFPGIDYHAGGGTWQLSLQIAHPLKGDPSPALFYGISHPLGEKARFTYLCLVTHGFPGDAAEVADHFRFRRHVLDGVGELELAGGAHKSSFNILYSITVKQKRGARADETLAVCKAPVKLAGGRIFLVDISRDTPFVEQVDYPLPDLPADRDGYDEKVREVLDDMKKSIAAGRTKKVSLELRPPKDKLDEKRPPPQKE
jgi:hypothetical protein